MGVIMKSTDAIRIEAEKLRCEYVIEPSDVAGYTPYSFGLDSSIDMINKNLSTLHITKKDNDESCAYVFCCEISKHASRIAAIEKKLQDKKLACRIFLASEKVSQHFADLSLQGGNGKSDQLGDQSGSEVHLSDLLKESGKMRATNIWLSIPTDKKGVIGVQYRVDGRIINSPSYNKRPYELGAVIGKCIFSFLPKEAGNQSSGEFNTSHDVEATFSMNDKRWRASLFPADKETVISIRDLKLEVDDNIPTLEGLGFNAKQSLVIRDMMRRGFGLLLVTGPTGSGKTTTQWAMIDELNDGSRKIYELADPVEKRAKGLHQASVEEEGAVRNFERFSKNLLRQNPDVVIFGEMRSRSVMERVIRLGTTGHMVFGTLHTASGTGAVMSIVYDLGIPVGRIVDPSLLRGIIYQRLLGINCPKCALNWQEYKSRLSSYDTERVEQNVGKKHLAELRFVNHDGCDHCEGQGVMGLTVVAEVVPVDSPALAFIKDMDVSGWEDYLFVKKGWPSIKSHALEKIRVGTLDYFACETQLGDLGSASSYFEFDPAAIEKRLTHVQQ